jgi:hypothetical membrane protein
MELLKSHYNIVATIIFVIFIIIAHLFATNTYSFSNNTISDLGSQGYGRKLIMQAGFLLFGITLAIGIYLNGFSWRTLPILIYGLSISFTGIFCTKPFLTTDAINYSVLHSNLHSTFAQLAGIAFSIGIVTQIFFSTGSKIKIVHLIFFLTIIGLSLAFGLLKSNQGILQRLLYLTGFIWLVKFYKP